MIRKWFQRAFLIMTGTLFVLGLALFGQLWWLYHHPMQLWQQITHVLESQSGLKLTTDALSFERMEGMRWRLDARYLNLYAQVGEAPILALDDLHWQFDLQHIWEGKIEIAEFRLAALHAVLEWTPEGDLKLGSWVIPMGQSSGVDWPLPRIHLQHWELREARVMLRFPPAFRWPPLQIHPLQVQWQKGNANPRVSVEAVLEWGGQSGKFQAEFTEQGPLWQGHYRLEEFPLDPLWIPGIEDVFPEMTVAARISLEGTAETEAFHTWRGQLAWQVPQGSVFNAKFPQGKLPMRDLKGSVTWNGAQETSTEVKVRMDQLVTHFGVLQATADFVFEAGQPPVLIHHAHSENWEWNLAKPYVKGFVPSIAGDWIHWHLNEGRIPQVDFDLTWKITTDYQNLADVLQLELRTSIEDVKVLPYTGYPEITHTRGTLKLNLDWLTIDLKEGRAPGVEVQQGQLRLGHGVPLVTPLFIEAQGQAEGAEAWPALRPIWMEQAPWLENLELQGKATAKFWLQDEDLSGEKLPELGIEIRPEALTIGWQTPQRTFRVQTPQGALWVSLHELALRDVQFYQGKLKGQLAGTYHFTTASSNLFQVNLEHLETLLPNYAQDQHPMATWWPQQLQGTLQLSQRWQPATSGTTWDLKLQTLDERQQIFTLEMETSGQGWKIPSASGQLGRLTLEGSLNPRLQQGQLRLKAPGEKGGEIAWGWAKGEAQLTAQFKQVHWPDWLGWSLGEFWDSPENQLADTESQALFKTFSRWNFELETPHFNLSPIRSVPIRMQGHLRLGTPWELDLESLRWGTEEGQVSFQGTTQQVSVNMTWKHLALRQWWLDLRDLKEQWAIYQLKESKNALKEIESPQDWRWQFQIGALELPGLPPQALRSQGHWQHSGERDRLETRLAISAQSVEVMGEWTPKIAKLRLKSDFLELQPWVKVAQAWEPLPEIKTKEASAWKLDLEAEASVFRVASGWQFPLKLKGRLNQTSEPYSPMALTLEEWRTPYAGGQAFVSTGGQKIDLKINMDHFALIDLLRDMRQADWTPWKELGSGKKQTPTEEVLVNFSLEAPQSFLNRKESPFAVKLQGSWNRNAQDWHLNFEQFAWNDQHGQLWVSQVRDQHRIRARFDRLDLQFWDELLERSDPEAPPEDQPLPPVSSGPLGREKFTLRLPQESWFLDVQADRLKFLNSVFEEFQGQLEKTADHLTISHFHWKRQGSTVFDLKADLRYQILKNLWEGTLNAEVSELGELVEILNSRTATTETKYPLQGGTSQLNAQIQLIPWEKKLWLPVLSFDFKSQEGIIKRGRSVMFLMATLSLQSYLRAIEGKLSGFEGEGLVYNTMQTKGSMTGGIFKLEDFVFGSPGMRFVASGLLDYEKDQQDLLICLQPFETLDKVLHYIPLLNWVLTNRRGSLIEACYKSTGSLDDPQFLPLPQTLIPGRLRDLFIFDLRQLEEAQKAPSHDFTLDPLAP